MWKKLSLFYLLVENLGIIWVNFNFMLRSYPVALYDNVLFVGGSRDGVFGGSKMKAEKVSGTETFTKTKLVNNRADKQNTASAKKAESNDLVTLSQDSLTKTEGEPLSRVDELARTSGAKKLSPDPRYTAQAILDRELLGLKKFYS